MAQPTRLSPEPFPRAPSDLHRAARFPAQLQPALFQMRKQTQPLDRDRTVHVRVNVRTTRMRKPLRTVGSRSNRPESLGRSGHPSGSINPGRQFQIVWLVPNWLDSTHLPVGPEPPWLSFTDWWGPRVPGHLLPPRARASVPESGQRREQCKVTSVTTFKRLPLHAINARRATAPEVALVSSFTCLARPWQRQGPRPTVSCGPCSNLTLSAIRSPQAPPWHSLNTP